MFIWLIRYLNLNGCGRPVWLIKHCTVNYGAGRWLQAIATDHYSATNE